MALDNVIDQINREKISRRGLLKVGAAAGIGIAGASIAGCIGDGGNATATPTAAPLKTKDVINVGYLPTDHDAPLFVAKTKGYFEKYGVNVNLTKFGAGPDIMAQMASGTIDVGIAGVPPVIIYIDKDTPAKIVAAVHNNGSGIFVRKGSGIKTVADLKGKKVATPGPGSIQDIMLRKLYADNGIDYSKETISKVAAGQMLGAMSSGNIDAAIAWEPFVTMSEMQGIGEVLLRSEDIRPGHPCDTVVASADMISKYTDSLKAFLKAHRDAVEFIKTNPDEAAEIVGSKEWLDTGADVEKAALPHMTFMVVPDEAYIAGTETFAHELKALEITRKDYTRDDLFDLSLINEL